MSFRDPATVIHRDTKRRCLSHIRQEGLPPGQGLEGRLRRYRSLGRELLARQSTRLGEEYLVGAYNSIEDARQLQFLHQAGRAAATYSEFASSVESILFDCESGEVRDIATLIAVFSILFDGLADESPTIFGELRPNDIPLPYREHSTESSPDAHPLAALTLRTASVLTDSIKECDGWSSLPAVRKRVTESIAATMRAERRSLRYQSFHSSIRNASVLTKIMRAKSEKTVLLLSLVPMCVHGVSPGLDYQSFSRSMLALGSFVGWLDDIDDLLEDLQAERWSEPLLTLYRSEPGFRELRSSELAYVLSACLAYETLTEKICSNGASLYRRSMRHLEQSGASSRLLQLVVDLCYSSLAGELSSRHEQKESLR